MCKIILLMLSLVTTNYLFVKQDERPPLSFDISLTKVPKSRKEILVKAKLTNNSDVNVVIDKNLLGYKTTFTTTDGISSVICEVGSNYQGQYIVLQPKDSYQNYQTIRLDNDFFAFDGDYKLKLTYSQFMEKSYEGLEVWRGSADSNKIDLELLDGKVVH